jgi:hypothetical protein
MICRTGIICHETAEFMSSTHNILVIWCKEAVAFLQCKSLSKLDTEAREKIRCLCQGSNPDRPVVQSVVTQYTKLPRL